MAKRVADLLVEEKRVLATPQGFARFFLGLTPYPVHEAVMGAVAKHGSQVAVKAANESGKTSNIVCPLVLWHISVFPRGKVVSTAGAWRQVKDQLVPYLKRFSNRFPHLVFNDTNIVHRGSGTALYSGFSTNDAGKFEGYHGSAEEPLLMIVDEAKSVKTPIYEAIDRCNPQRLLLASSPGGPVGVFYDAFKKNAGMYQRFTLSALDCPHISKETIERRIKKWGLEHPLVKSMVFAEFMDVEEGAVLGLGHLERLMAEPPVYDPNGPRRARCDFAADGDENVFAMREGNRIRIVETWREKDTMATVGRFIALFSKFQLRPEEIEGDEGGMGKVIIDRMQEMGWPICRVNNGSAACDEHYANRASEEWYEGAKAIQDRKVIIEGLEGDEDLRGQLISRKGKFESRGKLKVESKEEMRKRNLPSPDRAEAVLALAAPARDNRSVNLIAKPDPFADWEDFGEAKVDEGLLAGMNAGC